MTVTSELPPTTASPPEITSGSARPLTSLAVAGSLGMVFAWSYWPTLSNIVHTWSTVADYSHGFLVLPVAGFILWSRRDQRPAIAPTFHWGGLSLIFLAGVLRWVAGKYFLDACDGWSLVVWIAGAIWIVGGRPLVRWTAPAVAFLLFAIPLPYSIETAVSSPLQRIAAKGSGWLLQTLGQPALPEGTTIVIGDIHLEISQACAGLRMFMGVVALAYVFAVFSKQPWWHKAAVLVAAIPVAIVANILRITATGLLYQLSANHDVRQRIHDYAGLFTILVAAAMLAIIVWYLQRAIRKVEQIDNRELFQLTAE